MKQYAKTNIGKVATDMTFVQSIWSLWYMAFLGIAHCVMLVISARTGTAQADFIAFSQQSTKVYMLVIGIISAYAFLSFYVKKGVTRREYFFGTTLGAIGVAIILLLLAFIFTGLQNAIINIFSFSPVIDHAPFLGFYTNWFSIIIVYIMSTLTFYFIGWLIGVGYYRYGWIIGFGFVAIGILFISLVEFLWTFDTSFLQDIVGPGRLLLFLTNFLLSTMPDATRLPIYVSFIGNVLLIAVALWAIRMVTKRVVIKVK